MDAFAYRAVVAEHIDGDSLRFDLFTDVGFGVEVHLRAADWECRLFGCNAAEKETQSGKDAAAYLATLLPLGASVTVVSRKWDKYGGRYLASITLADGRDVVSEMIGSGHAVKWDGHGTKPVPVA